MCSFSFEVFPPRKDENIKNLHAILDDLGQLSPNFISVTFGAGVGGKIKCNHRKIK